MKNISKFALFIIFIFIILSCNNNHMVSGQMVIYKGDYLEGNSSIYVTLEIKATESSLTFSTDPSMPLIAKVNPDDLDEIVFNGRTGFDQEYTYTVKFENIGVYLYYNNETSPKCELIKQ